MSGQLPGFGSSPWEILGYGDWYRKASLQGVAWAISAPTTNVGGEDRE
jgi:hypothetical protein